MKKSDLGHGSNDEKRKDLSRDIVPHHSRLEEEKLRRRREWMIQQKRQREHEELKKKKILEYEMKRSRQIGASNSRGRSMKERDTKTKTTDRTLDKAPVQKTAATTSNSSVMAEKLDTSSSRGSTTIFQGPEGIKISEEELHRIKVDICRNLTVKTPQSKLNRDIINPEDVVIIRRNGEGSKPIFEREEIQNTSKKVEEIKERRTVMTVESGDTGNRSESYRRRSSSPNLLRHHSRRSSSPRRSKYVIRLLLIWVY
ncbi:hypothetical protein M0802_015156 [Mischocyttarus mexicanus]|nr:hypothetical protein M0802_015156 [Mischocyttarus mexicanus]